jgi:hypothetical protein
LYNEMSKRTQIKTRPDMISAGSGNLTREPFS